MPFLPNCTVNIYKLPDTTSPVWYGITNLSGEVVDINGVKPSLPYGNYRIITMHCDYDDESQDFTIPTSEILTLSVGCTSSLENHRLNDVHIQNQPSSSTVAPTGSGMVFFGNVAPSGYLICNGSAISRSTYSALFAVIGTAYGIGDGVTTFNIPDMRGLVGVGVGNYGVDILGQRGGEQSHSMTVSEMPAHYHTIGVYGSGQPVGGVLDIIGYLQDQRATSSVGGNQPHNNMQPYVGINYIIKI